jgi:hypothetical protein
MADLFTVSELASYLQRDLDTSSATLAKESAQGIVRAYCNQEITTATNTSVKLPIDVESWSYVVYLPQRPVVAVSSVTVNGVTYVDGTDYAWNGFSPYIRLRKVDEAAAAFEDEPVAVVTYTSGYSTVPPAVKAVALAVAARQYDNPQGLRQVSVDDYAETRAGADDDLAGVSLLKAERAILDRYKRTVGSVVPR